MKNEFFKLPASTVISLLKSNEISIEEYFQSIFNRINEINPKTNAWVNLNYEKSMRNAKELDERIKSKEKIGIIQGIPIGVKDIFNTIDFPTEMGSPIWKGFTPGNDARVIYQIKMQGGIILGKTDTAEFAVHALGKSKNPYDKNRTPGTSSSGSAIAVSTFMVPFALGTQTAGSIIRPASYCGIFGFKPSFGLIPRTGMLKTTDTLDQIGYFSRTIQDMILLFDVLRVKGEGYPISHVALNNEKRQSIRNKKLKVRFVKTHVWNQADDFTKKEIQKFIDKLCLDVDFEVQELDLPNEFSLAHVMHEKIYAKSLSYYFKEEIKQESLISKVFYELADKSKSITLQDFDNAIAYQMLITRELDKLFEKFDVIISLSTAGEAPLLNQTEKEDPSLIWTMCGVPTINMPIIKSTKGLPIGIQAVARKYNDKLLLNFVNLLRKKEIIQDGPYPENF